MALTITYSFATTAESFTATAGADSTLSYDAANGNPAGALKSRITGRNKNNVNKWSRTLTFADMGVPSNATVTDITSGSYSWRCTEYTTGATSTQGPVTMSWTGNSATLVSSSTFAATGNYATATGVNKTGLSLAASTSVTIDISNTLATGNSSTAAVTLYQDQLTFSITYVYAYTPSGGAQTGGTAPVLKIKSPVAAGGIQTGGTATTLVQVYSALTGFGLGFGPVASAAISEALLSAAAPGAYVLNGASGSYTQTGSAATLKYARVLSASTGSYTLTGSAAKTIRGYYLASTGGVYAVTGNAAGTKATRVIGSTAGTYLLSGKAANALSKRVCPASPAQYLATGTAASMRAARRTAASAGQYALTGLPDLLLAGRWLSTAMGSYLLTGPALRLVTARRLSAAPGGLLVTGPAAQVLAARLLASTAGIYSVTGTSATGIYIRCLVCAALAGQYDCGGSAAGVIWVPIPPVYPGYPEQPPKVNYNTRGRITANREAPFAPDVPWRHWRGRS